MIRARQYEYQSSVQRLLSWHSTSRRLSLIAMWAVLLGLTVWTGGIFGLPAILIGSGMIVGTNIIWRRLGLRRAAKQLGFEYVPGPWDGMDYPWRSDACDDVDWTPPSSELIVLSPRFFNVLKGTIDGVRVQIFDVRFRSHSPGGHRRRRTTRRLLAGVVQVCGNKPLPCMRIEQPPSVITFGETEPTPNTPAEIPGTTYALMEHPTRDEAGKIISPPLKVGVKPDLTPYHDHVQLVKGLSDELISFLADNPGLMIDTKGHCLTVYCTRWWSDRRKAPINLPAFVEDVLYLRRLLYNARPHSGAKTAT